MIEKEFLDTSRKALFINLDNTIYGSFAEIGGGQEVARHFFKSGGASGTIAKTTSAYDMVFSDTIYGKCSARRYVSESRLLQMMDKEYSNLITVLCDERDSPTRYFSYCNTVTTLNYQKDNEAHGWIGVRFQLNPKSKPNDVILHVRLLEKDRLLQQNTLGELGVNLIYACFFNYKYPNSFLKSLIENIANDRIEIDMIRMKGPELDYVDNRLLALQLVKNEMTSVSVFNRHGEVLQPADMLYKKNIMLMRGSFRPITYVGFDMLKAGFALFKKDVGFVKEKTVVLCEMTLRNLMSSGDFDERDFLARVDILCGMGQNVMVSNFREFYKLAIWLRRFKIENIRMVIGALTFKNIIDKRYYDNLKGGILEALGYLFMKNLKVYLYPGKEKNADEIYTKDNIPVDDKIKYLFKYLVDNDFIVDIPGFRKEVLPFFSHTVLRKIKENDPEWEVMVPKYVSDFIKTKKLFGYNAEAGDGQN